jgi:hypothetical protein
MSKVVKVFCDECGKGMDGRAYWHIGDIDSRSGVEVDLCDGCMETISAPRLIRLGVLPASPATEMEDNGNL